MIGLMSCSQPSVRNAFGSYRTLAPVKLDDSFGGVVAGNIALGGAVVAMHAVVLFLIRRGVFRGMLKHKPKHREAHASWYSAAVTAGFPGVSIGAWLALYRRMFGPGTVTTVIVIYCAAAVRDTTVLTGTVIGIVGVSQSVLTVAGMIGGIAAVRMERLCAVKACSWEYDRHATIAKMTPCGGEDDGGEKGAPPQTTLPSVFHVEPTTVTEEYYVSTCDHERAELFLETAKDYWEEPPLHTGSDGDVSMTELNNLYSSFDGFMSSWSPPLNNELKEGRDGSKRHQ